ncbi:hypothetical protein RF11_13614 [Thelohanellus kitauei]|uniref:Uncharacterized protein n=1 Tax=Thelohanellus kitauei TaxID=669202 RepID=A0A0C2MPV4_THEKT|nr:hypothetical protein RF11_13614 [Thelohanellus kitauei]
MIYSQNIDEEENQRLLDNYIRSTESRDKQIQMDAVINLISRFYHLDDPEVDELLVEYFPKELYESFQWLSEVSWRIIQNPIMTLQFYSIYTFIFRNTNVLMNPKSQIFVSLFLAFIKVEIMILRFDHEKLIDSIIICVSYAPNQALFINENGVFNLYNLLNIGSINTDYGVRDMCRLVYTLHRDDSSALSRVKLIDNVKTILDKLSFIKTEIFVRILLMLMRMIDQIRLLDEIEFNVSQLYDVTTWIISRNARQDKNPKFLHYISRIWVRILEGSRNSIQIDTIDKLVTFASVFSNDILMRLHKSISTSTKLEITKTHKQRLYIVYLALVAFPTMNFANQKILITPIISLHIYLQIYIQNVSFKEVLFDDIFLIFQYFIKSLTILNFDEANLTQDIFRRFFRKLFEYQSLSLHCMFLFSQYTLDDENFSRLSAQSEPLDLKNIEIILYGLIRSLSDGTYISKLQSEKALFIYEDLKINTLPILNGTFIKSIFSQCESEMLKTIESPISENSGNPEHNTRKELMAMIIHSFNESCFLDEDKKNSLMRFYNTQCNHSSVVSSHDNSHDGLLESMSNSPLIQRIPFTWFFRLFILIFEFKFIFGDIDSKLDNLTF